MNVLLWYLWLIPLVFVHECGHAVVGRILGFRVFWISIGYGRQIFEWRILGVPLRFNLIPFGGATALASKTPAFFRLRLWLTFFAGPATHLVLLGACFFVLGFDFFRHQVLSIAVFKRIAPVEMFIYANGFLLLANLFLKQAGYPASLTYSDGYQLLKIPFLKEEEVEEYKGAYVCLVALELMRSGHTERAISLYEGALRVSPKNYTLCHDLAIARLMHGEYEQAREEFTDLMAADESRQIERRVILYNNIAWTNVVLGREELLAEADNYSEEAIRFAPKVTSIMGTRGAVLVMTGRVQEGLGLLKTAFRRHSDPSARASMACWIAVGAALIGEGSESSDWLQIAREESPGHHLLDQTEQKIRLALSMGNPLGKSVEEGTLKT